MLKKFFARVLTLSYAVLAGFAGDSSTCSASCPPSSGPDRAVTSRLPAPCGSACPRRPSTRGTAPWCTPWWTASTRRPTPLRLPTWPPPCTPPRERTSPPWPRETRGAANSTCDFVTRSEDLHCPYRFLARTLNIFEGLPELEHIEMP